jgi:hypothetical protein
VAASAGDGGRVVGQGGGGNERIGLGKEEALTAVIAAEGGKPARKERTDGG